MNRDTLTARIVTLACTAGLLVLIPTWMLWLSPAVDWRPDLVLTIGLMLPLLLPLPGLLLGRPKAYAWTAFIALLYFIHGVVESWAVWADSSVRGLALTETLLASLLFVAALLYTRWRARELKAGTR